jgi:hypothetical protein
VTRRGVTLGQRKCSQERTRTRATRASERGEKRRWEGLATAARRRRRRGYVRAVFMAVILPPPGPPVVVRRDGLRVVLEDDGDSPTNNVTNGDAAPLIADDAAAGRPAEGVRRGD